MRRDVQSVEGGWEEEEEEAIDSFNALGFKLRVSVCDVKRVGRENLICTYVDSFNLVLTQVDFHSNTKVENPCQSPSALKARSLAIAFSLFSPDRERRFLHSFTKGSIIDPSVEIERYE